MRLPIAYSLADIRNGTGWAKNVTFVAVPEVVSVLALEAERYRTEVEQQDSRDDRQLMQGAAYAIRTLADRFRDLK